MHRVRVDVTAGHFLDQLPQIHHDHLITEMFDYFEVVADEHQREAELFPKVHQQIEHLRLHRHVQRRNWFIGNDELRFHRQRPRDIQSLPLAAGKFMRKTISNFRAQLHRFEEFIDVFVRSRGGTTS